MVSEFPESGRSRVVIENLQPLVDGGRYPIKRVTGELVRVEADLFADGHDAVLAVLRYRAAGNVPAGRNEWSEAAFEFFDNDRWGGSFQVGPPGAYEFQVVAWVDHFISWRRDLRKRIEAEQDVRVDLEIGARLIDAASRRAVELSDSHTLARWAGRLRLEPSADSGRAAIDSAELLALMTRHANRALCSVSEQTGRVTVDRERASCSAWYEVFPRSCSAVPGQHGTLRDVIEFLPYVASMGFDVLYLPPIHPIGTVHRKGRNNNPQCEPGEAGSPWAIGSAEGGHKSILPQLGTLEDFRALVAAAGARGLEVALDIAFQCAPDHPWVKEHPDWFKQRPDGTIQYAENPPKKYQDIYPFDFECGDWQSLWTELKSVFEFWIGHDVLIFRVDNPHTKSFAFWEWCLGELRRSHPEALFLSEAFTRPKVMHRLAKLGFSQSYTYFTWRNTKAELIEYLTQLTQTPAADFFRPNFWPNTPDILPELLQTGGRSEFMSRVILAATLSSNYGVYGPAYELCENAPFHPAGGSGRSEEYLDSEKYEVRQRDLGAPHTLSGLLATLNQIRRSHPALHRNDSIHFHPTDSEHVLAYSKRTADRSDRVLVAVNLDPHQSRCAWIDVDLEELGLSIGEQYEVEDLLTGQRYRWTGSRNFVDLNPHTLPAHVLAIQPKRG